MDSIKQLGLHESRKRFLDYQTAYQWDCESLLGKFASSSSFAFGLFSNVWRSSKFGLVFCGKYSIFELGHYTQLLLQCTKKYLIYSKSQYVQVGALYLLYALYNKQPVRHLVKIRLLMNEMKIIDALLRDLKEKDQLEPLLIFKSLLDSGAFDFVASQNQISPENKYISDDVTLCDDIFVLKAGSFIQNFTEETKTGVANLRRADDAYQRLLKDYLSKNSGSIGFDQSKTGILPINKELEEIFSEDHDEIRRTPIDSTDANINI